MNWSSPPDDHDRHHINDEHSEEIMLIVVARYLVTDGHESGVARLLRRNAEASRAEPGCLEFSVYQEIDNPRVFLLYERYTNEDAFQAHRQTPHFKDIIEQQVVPLLDERAWTRMEPLPAN
jgi:quinol monooxygenase YgiN